MQWTECIPNTTAVSTTNTTTTTTTSSNNNNNNNIDDIGVGGGGQVLQQQLQQQLPIESSISSSSSCGAPTIKNHSVTHFGRYLYCFGGYDGRRNHTTVLVYDLISHIWIRPIHINNDNDTSTNTITTTLNTTITTTQPMILLSDQMYSHQQQQQPPQLQQQQQAPNSLPSPARMIHDDDDDDTDDNDTNTTTTTTTTASVGQQQQHHQNPLLLQQHHPLHQYSQNSNTSHGGMMNHHHHHHTDRIILHGTPPPGRNGHSATLAVDTSTSNNTSTTTKNGRIVIIGGWLGTGPLAASDTHILDVRDHGTVLQWSQPTISGTPPGPCNMHSADYVSHLQEVYVFRGGNGREYLNDLHALHVPTMTWRKVLTSGDVPQQRANHSSAILEETKELFIFGGWNGTERLNDIHILDTTTSTWSYPKIYGILPHPRAGMTLTALRGRLYLFGGSGQLAKCFYDLQIFDRASMTWLDVSQMDHQSTSSHDGGISDDNNNNNSPNRNSHNHNNSLIPSHHHHHQQQQYHQHNEPQFIYGGNQHYGNGGVHNGNHLTTSIFGGYQDDAFEPQQVGVVQEGSSNVMNINTGGNNNNNNIDRSSSSTLALPDWRSREYQYRVSTQHQHVSPNPNDEDTVPSVLVRGHGPARRAGHTATAVGRQIYVFGGSYGSKYLNDFFILDTDPPPQAIVTELNSLQLMERRLRHFFNEEEFADVTFIVQGQKVYGHKMILSIVSECFRAMFTTGFRESDEQEIEIQDCTYAAFVAVMEYIYTGTLPSNLLDVPPQQYQNWASTQHVVRVVEILEVADRFFLDHLKQICETKLQNAVTLETVDYLLPVAQKTNSNQLQSICEHLIRNK